MAGREPSWWYGAGADGWMPRLLAPLGAAYGLASARRLGATPAYRADVPVIAIGNFTAGGTGKTPFVRVVAGVMRQLGHSPVVLSRGYGGRIAGPHWVDAVLDTAAHVGDEPLLLADTLPVMVARDRTAGARAIEAAAPASPHATVIIMDDGLQNPALAKDVSLVMIDAARGFGNGRCIPAGPLRAPLAVQMPRADALVLNGGGRAPGLEPLLAAFAGPVFTGHVAASEDVAALRGLPVIAYAGIGVPNRFFATLAAAGANVLQQIGFADHHAYTSADATRLLDLAKAAHATLMTTEKDIVRLRGQPGALEVLHTVSLALPVHLVLDAASEAGLVDLLQRRIGRPTSRADEPHHG